MCSIWTPLKWKADMQLSLTMSSVIRNLRLHSQSSGSVPGRISKLRYAVRAGLINRLFIWLALFARLLHAVLSMSSLSLIAHNTAMPKPSVLVIGGGAFGSSTAFHLNN